MSITKILNPEECGWKELHFMFNQILVTKRWPASEEIDIDYVRVIEDHSHRKGPNAMKQASSSIIATMLFGLAGAMMSSLQEGYEVNTDLDIILKDGTVIEVCVTDKKLVAYLSQYMRVADPRAKHRKLRGLR